MKIRNKIMRQLTLRFIILFVVGQGYFTSGFSQFAAKYGGAGNETGKDCLQGTDSIYYITGGTTILPSGAFLLKINNTGIDKAFYIYGGNSETGNSLIKTPNNKILIAGATSTTMSNDDGLLLNINEDGTLIWDKKFSGNNGGGDDEFESVILTDSGDYVITGTAFYYSNYKEDVILLKIDTAGTILWSKRFGGAEKDVGVKVIETADNGFLIGGSTKSYGTGDRYGLLIKTDNNGDTLWTKILGGSSSNDIYDIVEDSNGDLLVVGRSYNASGAFITKFDNLGQEIWNKLIKEVEFFYGLTLMNNEIYITGSANRTQTASTLQNLLIRMDSNGDTLATAYHYYDNLSRDAGFKIIPTSDNHLLITGQTQGTGFADDIFVGIFSADFLDNCNVYSDTMISISNNSFTYAAGIEENTYTFTISTANVTESLNFSNLGTIYCVPTTSIEEKQKKNHLAVSVFPNPAFESFTIELSDKQECTHLFIYDTFGRIVLQSTVNKQKQFTVNTLSLPSGFYYYSISSEGMVMQNGKIFIMSK